MATERILAEGRCRSEPSRHRSDLLQDSRKRPLTIVLSALFAAPLAMAGSAGPANSAFWRGQWTSLVSDNKAPTSQQPISMLNCGDAGPGSLRDAVNTAASGTTIDLTNMPCGEITLSTGEIVVAQDDLTILGPGPGRLTISANGLSRAFNHEGIGTLSVVGMSVVDGAYQASGSPYSYGGCIFSKGTVYLENSIVTGCIASGTSASGGAIFGYGVRLFNSAVSHSMLMNCTDVQECGAGGIQSKGSFSSKYSSISYDQAPYGTGGVVAFGSTLVVASTFDHNSGYWTGALATNGATTIRNSTISSNLSSNEAPALNVRHSPLSIVNSTIVFNHVSDPTSPNCHVAVCVYGNSLSWPVTIQSSIVANNTDGNNLPSDLYVEDPVNGITGADNLIIARNVALPDFVTVSSDPKLGPLQPNGGLTLTHQLMRDSPALGMGNNSVSLLYDQRSINYPRTTGTVGSVDIGAVQFDEIFVWRD